MGLKGRMDRLEIEAEEIELRRQAEELAAEYGIDVDQLVEDSRRTYARVQVLKRQYPSAAVKDDDDIEPYLRMVAEEEGLDPDEVIEEARRIAERRHASRQSSLENRVEP